MCLATMTRACHSPQYVCPINGVVHTCGGAEEHPFLRHNGTTCAFSGAVVSQNMVSDKWYHFDGGAADDGDDQFVHDNAALASARGSMLPVLHRMEAQAEKMAAAPVPKRQHTDVLSGPVPNRSVSLSLSSTTSSPASPVTGEEITIVNSADEVTTLVVDIYVTSLLQLVERCRDARFVAFSPANARVSLEGLLDQSVPPFVCADLLSPICALPWERFKNCGARIRVSRLTDTRRQFCYSGASLEADYFWETLLIDAATHLTLFQFGLDEEHLQEQPAQQALQNYYAAARNFGAAWASFFGSNCTWPVDLPAAQHVSRASKDRILPYVETALVSPESVLLLQEELRLMLRYPFTDLDVFAKTAADYGTATARTVFLVLLYVFVYMLTRKKIPPLVAQIQAKQGKYPHLTNFSWLLCALLHDRYRADILSLIQQQVNAWVKEEFLHPLQAAQINTKQF